MMPATRIVSGALLVVLATPLQSQRFNPVGLQQTPRAPVHLTGSMRTSPRTAVVVPSAPTRSYWLPGMIIGGVIGLVGGLQVQHDMCHESGCSNSYDHVLFLLPTMVLAVVGGLIGSMIHRRE